MPLDECGSDGVYDDDTTSSLWVRFKNIIHVGASLKDAEVTAGYICSRDPQIVQHLPDEIIREVTLSNGDKGMLVATDISVMKHPKGAHRPVFCIKSDKGPPPPIRMTLEEFRKA